MKKIKVKKWVFFLTIFCFQLPILSQVIPDSLENKTYKDLYDGYYYSSDKKTKNIYTNAFLLKSKKEKNIDNILEGYYMKTYIYEDERKLMLADSIISLSKNNSNKFFPALAYYTKAKFYYKKRDFKRAMDNGLESLFYSEKFENKHNIATSNLFIGVLKSRMGENQNAINILKKNYYYMIKNNIKSNILPTIFALSTAYQEDKKLDSASLYNNLGYTKSLKNDIFKNYFRLNEGVVSYYRNQYSIALDSIDRCISTLQRIDDKPNLAISYFYKTKIYKLNNEGDKMIKYLKKVDTIFKTNQDLHPKIRDTYSMLISYYKDRDDLEQQLNYINKLIKLDSVLHSNELYVNKNLIEKYDIPKLISEKEKIINTIKEKVEEKTYYLLIFVFVTIFMFIMVCYQYYKRKIYKQRFLKLINNERQATYNYPKKNIEPNNTNTSLGISDEVINHILNKLKEFENENLFISSDLTSNLLANQIGTNVKYLSKVVNRYKNESFTHYINNLRVEYAIKKLKENENFRKYTLAAIANEIGFKKAESFSKAFKRQTNITPAFFIKELHRND